MPSLELKTRVVIFMHYREFPLVTNTGVLAHQALKNSRIVFRGHTNRVVNQRSEILENYNSQNTFILFPDGRAPELNADFVAQNPGPITLICPDGHWGQAKKILRKEASLQGLPRVQLPAGALSRYRLRQNTAGHVCTYEAIAKALGVLEGEKVQNQLETTFEKMVTRLLWLRGSISADQVLW